METTTKDKTRTLRDELFAGKSLFKDIFPVITPFILKFDQLIADKDEVSIFLEKYQKYFLQKENVKNIKEEWIKWIHKNNQIERLFLVYRQLDLPGEKNQRYFGLVVYKCIILTLENREEYMREPLAVINFSTFLC